MSLCVDISGVEVSEGEAHMPHKKKIQAKIKASGKWAEKKKRVTGDGNDIK